MAPALLQTVQELGIIFVWEGQAYTFLSVTKGRILSMYMPNPGVGG